MNYEVSLLLKTYLNYNNVFFVLSAQNGAVHRESPSFLAFYEIVL